jgi:hypothetical protein
VRKVIKELQICAKVIPNIKKSSDKKNHRREKKEELSKAKKREKWENY